MGTGQGDHNHCDWPGRPVMEKVMKVRARERRA